MRILGIDPGFAIVGYGVVDFLNNKLVPIDFGVVTTPAGMPSPQRLNRVYEGMRQLIELHKPDCIAIEELFFYNNAKTAIGVSQARGVLLLAAQQSGKDLYEYTPMQIKQAAAGHGHADKVQVQGMVKTLLNLKTVPKPDDAADALAIAICHAFTAEYARQDFMIK